MMIDDIGLALSPLETFLELLDASGEENVAIAQVAQDLVDSLKDKLEAMVNALEAEVGRIKCVRKSEYPRYLGPIIDVIVVPPLSHR